MRPKRQHRPWYFAWRPLHVDDEETFDILVGRPWLLSGAAVLATLTAVLLVAPRQRWPRLLGRIAAVLGALGLTGLVGGIHGTLFPALRRVRLPLRGLPPALDGLRIMHLSDFHLGMPFSIGAARRAMAITTTLAPDLIVLTGDFISYRHHLPLLRSVLAGIRAPLGVFAVFGNHDHKTDPATAGARPRKPGRDAARQRTPHRPLPGCGVRDRWHRRYVAWTTRSGCCARRHTGWLAGAAVSA